MHGRQNVSVKLLTFLMKILQQFREEMTRAKHHEYLIRFVVVDMSATKILQDV